MSSNDNMRHTMKTNLSAWQLIRVGAFAIVAASALAGCGGGASTTQQPSGSGSGGSAPKIQTLTADSDEDAFAKALWPNIVTHCSGCHSPGNGASAYPFASNDSHSSYITANQDKYIDRITPANSGMVLKVASGHNCWSTPSECKTSLTTWITNWVQPSVANGSTTPATVTQISAVPGTPVTDSITLPAGVPATYYTDFNGPDSSVHSILVNHCSNCHVPTAAQPQQPYFAVSDPQASYDAVRSNAKINPVQSDQSRLFLRLATDHHNCWTAVCIDNSTIPPGGDAGDMLAAIDYFLTGVPSTTLDPNILASYQTLLAEGLRASSGPRVEDAQIAVYNFDEGSLTTIHDGAAAPYNLTITSGTNYKWLTSWGLHIGPGVKIRGPVISTSAKMASLGSSGFTIEAWVIPDNTSQEANIVGINSDIQNRDFSLAQYQDKYEIFTRESDASNNPLTDNAGATNGIGFRTGKILPSLQHVVLTYTPNGGRHVYVNGTDTGDTDALKGFATWDSSYTLVLGNEGGTGAKDWIGTIRKVAIHSRALTPSEIQENYASGVGQKYLLMFNISNVKLNGVSANVPANSYIYMTVQDYDDYSYLFYKPTYINLTNPDATLPAGISGSFTLKGIHLGVNGREAIVGQAFADTAATINDDLAKNNQQDYPQNASAYLPGMTQGSGQVLSYVGTVIPKDNGGTQDHFFLSFEQIGTATTSPTDRYNPPLTLAQLASPPPNHRTDLSDVMIHTFEEINAGLAKVTGVNRTDPKIGGTTGAYTTLYQQLPASEAIDGFLASHQMGIAQLAIQYCSVLVDDTTKNATYFPNVNFSGMTFTSAVDNSDASKEAIITPLLVHLLDNDKGVTLTDVNNSGSTNKQPSTTTVHDHLAALIKVLVENHDTDVTSPCSGNSCSARRTADIVKATCAAAYASAPMLLQ